MSETVQQVPYNFYSWETENGPKERLDSIAHDMAEFMLNHTEFGTYCHEGGDLLSDYIKFAALKLNNDENWELYHSASEIVDKLEGAECGVCNDEGERND